MRRLIFILSACSLVLAGQAQNQPVSTQPSSKTILLEQSPGSPVTDEEFSRLFSKICPNYRVSTSTGTYDYVLKTAFETKEGTGRRFGLFDSHGVLIRSTGSRPSGAVKDLCFALESSVPIDVVDGENLIQSSDLRRAPSQPGVAGVADAIHGRRNTLTDNASLRVVANGEHALLDCYEHHKGCTTVGPGKYYAEIDGDSMWIDYEMPITHEPMRNHYVITGSW